MYILQRNRKLLPFLERTFQGLFGGVRSYVRCCEKTEFVAHCEIVLVVKLMELGEVPTAVGISKAACPMCHRFIQRLNNHLNGEGCATWVVGGEHQTMYPWKEIPVGNMMRRWKE